MITSKKKASFAGDVLKLVSGTAFSQIVTILAAPLLTRLYTPEAYGVAALFASITGIFSIIACMRYELTIMLPNSDGEAANLLGISLAFTLVISMLTVPIIWLAGKSILRWLNSPGLAPYLWLVPPTVFISGIFIALSYWNSRKRQFGHLSIARVTSSMTTTALTLGVGYAGYATGGTIIGAKLVGQTVAMTVLGKHNWKDDGKLFKHTINLQGMFSGIKRYQKFPLYGAWSALFNAGAWQMPTFLLSSFFSSTVVGYYALGFQILQLPISLIGGAVSEVFFQRAAKARVDGSLPALVENIFQRLVTISLFPMLMLIVIGRDLYVAVFGSNWAEAGVYTQILSVWAFFWFISSPLSALFSILEKQEYSLKFNIVLFITRLICLAIGGYLNDARLSMYFLAVSGALMYGYLNFSIMEFSGVSWLKSLKIMGRGIVQFLPLFLVQIIVNIICENKWFRLSAACIIGISYLLILNRYCQHNCVNFL